MPFNGNVGIHDADTWRSEYGGEIYKTSGSHGCVNTPTANAEKIFNTVEIGTPVIVY
ncbi:MAG: L,D-transpeptidase [Lachnospiraceae bacterium]|jgi:lipoprotein-anchoring transpeptidase ErfK/SrfK